MRKLSMAFTLAIVLAATAATTLQALPAQSTCFRDYQDNVLQCSYRPHLDQELCNLDAATTLAGCIHREIFG